MKTQTALGTALAAIVASACGGSGEQTATTTTSSASGTVSSSSESSSQTSSASTSSAGGASSSSSSGGASSSTTGGGGQGGVASSSASSSTAGGQGGASSSSSSSTGGVGGAGASSSSSTGGSSVCGDGVIEGSEQCDLGPENGTSKGCSATCTFDCSTDADCDALNAPCLGAATCSSATVQGETVMQCVAGAPLMQGASCGMNLYCVDMSCVAPSCGDGVVEAPEECDEGSANGPGTGCESDCSFTCLAGDPTRDCSSTNACVADGTCDATTHTCTAGSDLPDGTPCSGGVCESGACVPSQCGNGVLEAGEQCDDGNLFDLDGCDSSCKYEVVTRLNSLAFSGNAAPAALGCTPATNAFGAKALTSTARNQINSDSTTDIDEGTINSFLQFIGLSDLNGITASGFSIGVLNGFLDPAKGTWPNNNPIDWWFLADPSTVSMGLPTGLFTNATLANRNLKAGPSTVTLTLNLGGSAAPITMLSAHLGATINGNPPPNVPAPPPAELASGLTVFQTISGSGAGQGLCGNFTVASLAKVPVPASLAQGGGAACGACPGSHTYTACPPSGVGPGCNSMLDVLVGGCAVFNCLATAVNATQPDVPFGASVTPLTLGANNKVSQDVSNDDDAYSAYLVFTTNRAHFTGETCVATSDCQTGKTCSGGVCK